LLQPEATSTFSESDSRPWKDPWLFARASRLAAEFHTDFGVVFRAGCEIQALVRVTDFLQGTDQRGLYGESSGEFAVGVGYLWSDRVRVDYALVSTPDLGSSQRVTLALVFGGKPKVAPQAAPRQATMPAQLQDVPADSTTSVPVVPRTVDPSASPATSDTLQPSAPVATTPTAPAVAPMSAPNPDEDAPEQLSH